MKAALIGHGIRASLTPDLHRKEAENQGFDYTYERYDTATPPYAGLTIGELLDRAQDDGLSGVNVTHPFKIKATHLMDELSETARSLGAVNTVVFKNDRRIGHNTDYAGFRSALRHRLHMASIARVMVVGAGGAGSAVALALVDQGAQTLVLVDRDRSSAEALRNRLMRERPFARIEIAENVASADPATLTGIVNATPMGMATHPGLPFDPVQVGTHCWIADIVYFPRDTALLKAARAASRRTLDGSDMAVFQAVGAFTLITGKTASAQRMAKIFENILRPFAMDPVPTTKDQGLQETQKPIP